MIASEPAPACWNLPTFDDPAMGGCAARLLNANQGVSSP